MLKLTAPLQTVTPLFLGGSDPRETAELRPASFRGALRFWLRALIGAHVENLNLDALRQAEAAVFGDTAEIGGSPVILRLSGSPEPVEYQAVRQKAGLRYLFFSMGQRQGGITRWRKCFPAGGRFELTLQTRSPGRSDGQETAFRRAAAALWLLSRLGGLGARSRRGAGSLCPTGAPQGWPSDLPAFQSQARTPRALQEELAESLRVLPPKVGLGRATKSPEPSPFDILHPDACRICVLDKPWRSWEDALDSVGGAFQAFRRRRPPDYDNVKGVVSGRSKHLDPVQRAAFGLPIVFYFSSLGGAKGTLEGATHNRRASPLLVKVAPLADGRCAVVLTRFRAPLLGRDERLTLKLPSGPVFAPPPDLDLIDDFLDALKPGGANPVAPLLEVNYR